MILSRVYIENFKSIDMLEIDFKQIDGKSFFTLLGMNETGKSSFLQAINLINQDSLDYKSFCQRSARNKGEDIHIEYTFKALEFEKLFKNILTKNSSIPSELKEHLKLDSLTLVINISNNNHINKSFSSLFLKETDQLLKMLRNYIVNQKSGDIQQGLIPNDKPLAILRHIEEKLYEEIQLLFFQKIPKVIFWEPSPEYLITGQINLNAFKGNFNISKPLYNIFKLQGYSDEQIVRNIDNILADPEAKYEFEELLSTTTTEYINSIWPEHNIEVEIKMEGAVCSLFIKDKNTTGRFNMDSRSDGFKHFMSLLLSLSVEYKNSSLENTIILLDEPEKSLHPGSIKYLRDELLNISRSNTIIASSHSPFIIDRYNLDRHFIVNKIDGITTINRVDPNNPMEEEIIYESLGTSIFDLVEPVVLIFEGRSDKEIFDLMSRKLLGSNSLTSEIKAISASGCEKIPKLVKFFNNKFIDGFVVFDEDKPGRSQKESIIKETNEFSEKVYTYKDILGDKHKDKTDILLEDLLPEQFISDTVRECFDYEFERKKSDISILNEFKKEKKLSNDEEFKLKEEICKKLKEDLSSKSEEDVKVTYPHYFEFIDNIYKVIKENKS